MSEATGPRRFHVVRAHEAGRPEGDSNACRFAGWPVTAKAPSVRPWKEPSGASQAGLPVALRPYLSAASTASAPELQAISASKRSERRWKAPSWARSVEVGDMPSWSAARWAAAVTSGCTWPRPTTAMPAAKSRYVEPSSATAALVAFTKVMSKRAYVGRTRRLPDSRQHNRFADLAWTPSGRPDRRM